ncbi:MAG: hypothetical protein DMG01_27025, partial [Acidobacteria bacterium]
MASSSSARTRSEGVARRWFEDLGDQLAHRNALLSQKVIDFSEHQSGYDDEARRGQSGFVFRKTRFTVRPARERPKKPARVGD